MNELRYTLVSDGSSDRSLIPILTWLLRNNGITAAIQPTWADLSRLPQLKANLGLKVKYGIEFYSADLLFIHRDAERELPQERVNEIQYAVESLDYPVPPYVCVIPVRMTEAWLLVSSSAIRHASGNPNGQKPLEIPPLHNLESLSNPKNILFEALKEASELSGRRLKKYPVNRHALRVSNYFENNDFLRLRTSPSFETLETDLQMIIQEHSWSS